MERGVQNLPLLPIKEGLINIWREPAIFYFSTKREIQIDYEKDSKGGREREKHRADNIVNFYNIALNSLIHRKRETYIQRDKDKQRNSEKERERELKLKQG